MRITNSSTSDSLVSRLQQLSTRQSQLQNQVSSQQRFTKASEEPAAMSRVLQLQAEQQQLQQWSRNSEQASNISNASFSAVSQIKSVSDRAGELAVLGSTGIAKESMPVYAKELDALLEQALQTANTQYSGQFLFGGTQTDSAPFQAERDASGQITSISYVGASTSPQFRVGEGSPLSPYTDATGNQEIAGFLNNLVALRTGLNSGDAAAVEATRPNLESSENSLLVTISDIGATQTRLEVSADQSEARFAQLQDLTGRETDIDVASTMVQYSRAQASYETALKTGAQVLQMSLLDYIR
jgi:flagellar hook-associated protein 3 FlgL